MLSRQPTSNALISQRECAADLRLCVSRAKAVGFSFHDDAHMWYNNYQNITIYKRDSVLFHSQDFIISSKINNNGYIHIDSDFDINSNTV